MNKIEITDGVVTIELPGMTAIRVDTTTRLIAVDLTSGVSNGPIAPTWQVHDLRDGIYGDFHGLTNPERCADVDCARSEHLAVPEPTP